MHGGAAVLCARVRALARLVYAACAEYAAEPALHPLRFIQWLTVTPFAADKTQGLGAQVEGSTIAGAAADRQLQLTSGDISGSCPAPALLHFAWQSEGMHQTV